MSVSVNDMVNTNSLIYRNNRPWAISKCRVSNRTYFTYLSIYSSKQNSVEDVHLLFLTFNAQKCNGSWAMWHPFFCFWEEQDLNWMLNEICCLLFKWLECIFVSSHRLALLRLLPEFLTAPTRPSHWTTTLSAECLNTRCFYFFCLCDFVPYINTQQLFDKWLSI